MPEKSLEARVAAIEAQLAGKNLETHFREQAELIDRLFTYRFEQSDKKWDGKLGALRVELGEMIDVKLDQLEARIDTKLAAGLSGLEQVIDVKLGKLDQKIDSILARLPDPTRSTD